MQDRCGEMSFRNLKVGDKVTRLLAQTIKMEMIVVAVKDKFIYCDAAQDRPMKGLSLWQHWKFDRDTGLEEEDRMSWTHPSKLIKED